MWEIFIHLTCLFWTQKQKVWFRQVPLFIRKNNRQYVEKVRTGVLFSVKTWFTVFMFQCYETDNQHWKCNVFGRHPSIKDSQRGQDHNSNLNMKQNPSTTQFKVKEQYFHMTAPISPFEIEFISKHLKLYLVLNVILLVYIKFWRVFTFHICIFLKSFMTFTFCLNK
jgi:hypothetical protein